MFERLISNGISVIGTYNPKNNEYEKKINNSSNLIPLDITDQTSLIELISSIKPKGVFNFAAQANSRYLNSSLNELLVSNTQPIESFLSSIKMHSPHTRFFQASSSEVFAKTKPSYKNETSEKAPANLYGMSKFLADEIVKYYRRVHSLFAYSGFLFPHDSIFGKNEHVLKKIARVAALSKLKKSYTETFGSLDAARDWGCSIEFSEGIFRSMLLEQPEDFVFGTGTAHSVKQAVQFAFEHLALDYREHVNFNSSLLRENDSSTLVADISKATNLLGWKPKRNLRKIMVELVEHQIQILENEYEH